MRCKNCHAVMMDTDAFCPSCRASAASATAAAPGEFSKPSPMLMALPILGGAVGGALYGALTAPSGRSSSLAGAPVARRSSPLKWMFGLLFILVGILFLVLALVSFCDIWDLARRERIEVTAAELSRIKDPKASPGAWIAYSFEESKPIEMPLTRQRLGHGGDVNARCLLVKVEDKWLIASVAPGFEGNQLVGRLVPLESPPSKLLIEKIRGSGTNPAAVLPYEFNSVDGSASDQHFRYTGAALVAFFGLLGLLLGLFLVCRRRRVA